MNRYLWIVKSFKNTWNKTSHYKKRLTTWTKLNNIKSKEEIIWKHLLNKLTNVKIGLKIFFVLEKN